MKENTVEVIEATSEVPGVDGSATNTSTIGLYEHLGNPTVAWGIGWPAVAVALPGEGSMPNMCIVLFEDQDPPTTLPDLSGRDATSSTQLKGIHRWEHKHWGTGYSAGLYTYYTTKQEWCLVVATPTT